MISENQKAEVKMRNERIRWLYINHLMPPNRAVNNTRTSYTCTSCPACSSSITYPGTFFHPLGKDRDSAIGMWRISDSWRRPEIYNGREKRRSERDTRRDVYVRIAGRREKNSISPSETAFVRLGTEVEATGSTGL